MTTLSPTAPPVGAHGLQPPAQPNQISSLAGAAGEALWSAVARCRWGWALIVADRAGIRSVALADDADALRQPPTAALPGAGNDTTARAHHRGARGRPWWHGTLTAPLPAALREAVLTALDTPATAPVMPLPLAPMGTPWQQRVWDALRALPAGGTITYGALAHRLGLPHAARAVASACAANPLAVLIPCHRVVAADGSLGGYRWGLPRKRALLVAEGALG